MQRLIPIETLSFYLSNNGFSMFRQWCKTIEILKPIHNDLENLATLTENSTWLEEKYRKDIMNKTRFTIIKHVEKTIGEKPEKHFQNWIQSIQPYCFQGGYGHRIQYTGDFPHHWCVRCEHYEKVKDIPQTVVICGVICDKYINLAVKPDTMYWS